MGFCVSIFSFFFFFVSKIKLGKKKRGKHKGKRKIRLLVFLMDNKAFIVHYCFWIFCLKNKLAPSNLSIRILLNFDSNW